MKMGKKKEIRIFILSKDKKIKNLWLDNYSRKLSKICAYRQIFISVLIYPIDGSQKITKRDRKFSK